MSLSLTGLSPSERYPLHTLVWNGDFRTLAQKLARHKSRLAAARTGQLPALPQPDVDNSPPAVLAVTNTDDTPPPADPEPDQEEVLDLDRLDPRGRSALLLAVIRGQYECAEELLRAGAHADLSGPSPECWSICDEAVASGDPELLRLCLRMRAKQAPLKRGIVVRELLQRLQNMPDFFVEMRWEFASWIPLVARMCPSDTCRVYKSGSAVRIDTGLLGFDGSNFVKGDRSLVFQLTDAGVIVDQVDHDSKTMLRDVLPFDELTEDSEDDEEDPFYGRQVTEAELASRLTSPLLCSYLDAARIEFEREKSGFWGWRSSKTEMVSGHSCRVFSASNIRLVTVKRTEHLTSEDKARWKQRVSESSSNPLEGILRSSQEESTVRSASSNEHATELGLDEYLDTSVSLDGRDVGRPQERVVKRQEFKASVWLSEAHPLSLQEQVLPVLDLLAARFTHFRQLRQFVELQLPAGFPLKIEIPLYHVVTARVTFSNLYGGDKIVSGVTYLPGKQEEEDVAAAAGVSVDDDVKPALLEDDVEDSRRLYQDSCLIDSVVFQPPENYVIIHTESSASGRNSRRGSHQSVAARRLREERRMEELYLQMALEQSLLDQQQSGPEEAAVLVDFNRVPSVGAEEEVAPGSDSLPVVVPLPADEDAAILAAALAASQREEQERAELARREEEELQRVLQLSISEQ